MVDFNKLRAEKTSAKPIDPLEIFRRLPKPLGINDLYTSQAGVLKDWFDRRTERDLVIKLHTGGGKTLVGLLIAQSVINETREPVIYLCPTVQLVEQTIAKAKEYGISAVPYKTGRGVPLPREFTSVQAILVGTYKALFNAKSKFGTRGGTKDIVKVGAVVSDDAHVASSAMREAFTLSVERSNKEEDFLYLSNLFRQDFIDLGRVGTFDDIVASGYFGVLEVPYWAWKTKSSAVRDYLQQRAVDFPMEWGFVRDEFNYSHCLISSASFSVSPMFPTVDAVPTFSECRRRVYMSATITDDSMLVRTFNADAKSLRKPIISNSLAGVSERMILAPELMSFASMEEQLTKETAKWMSTDLERSTVILASSAARAEKWSDVAEVAKTPQQVAEFVKALQTGTSHGPCVFANRYDGIDLPNDACRLLIMDELPQGANSYDLFRSAVFTGGEESTSNLARRIEQGIGRGARGSGDYCIVILSGSDLVAWVDRPANQKYLTSSTQAQLSIGESVSKSITSRTELNETMRKCLDRDEAWVSYHAERLAEFVQPAEADEKHLRFAAVERKSFELFRQNLFEKAVEVINKYCDANE